MNSLWARSIFYIWAIHMTIKSRFAESQKADLPETCSLREFSGSRIKFNVFLLKLSLKLVSRLLSPENGHPVLVSSCHHLEAVYDYSESSLGPSSVPCSCYLSHIYLAQDLPHESRRVPFLDLTSCRQVPSFWFLQDNCPKLGEHCIRWVLAKSELTKFYDICDFIVILKFLFLSNSIPGVILLISWLVLRPKLYFGDVSNIFLSAFSGQ